MGIKQNTKDTPPEGNKFALLIGVEAFSDPGIPSLRGVTKDINKLGKLLNNRQRSEFKVESLRNPSFVQSRKAISKISQQAQVNDVVFSYYSGHGVLDQQQSLYLIVRRLGNILPGCHMPGIGIYTFTIQKIRLSEFHHYYRLLP